MDWRCVSFGQLLAYAVAASLAVAITLRAQPVRSGEPPQEPAGPRWSASSDDRPAALRDCDRGGVPGAGYRPGIDAYGRPVPRADLTTEPRGSLPIEFDLRVGEKKIGGQKVELLGGRFQVDARSGDIRINGRPVQPDCSQPLK